MGVEIESMGAERAEMIYSGISFGWGANFDVSVGCELGVVYMWVTLD